VHVNLVAAEAGAIPRVKVPAAATPARLTATHLRIGTSFFDFAPMILAAARQFLRT